MAAGHRLVNSLIATPVLWPATRRMARVRSATYLRCDLQHATGTSRSAAQACVLAPTIATERGAGNFWSP